MTLFDKPMGRCGTPVAEGGRWGFLIRSQLGAWLLLNALVHLLSGIVLGGKGAAFPLAGWSWTALFAAVFWYPWGIRPASRRLWLSRFLWAGWTLWVLLAVGYRKELGSYPDHGTLEFLLSEPGYAWAMLWESFRPWMLFLAPLPVLSAWWLAGRPAGPEFPRWWKWLGLPLAVGFLIFLDRRQWSPRPMGVDVTTLRILAETRPRRIGSGALRRSYERERLPKGPTPPFHVLLLVHESLSAQAFDPELMPGLGARMARGELVAFPKAYASATMTDVALPALLTGLAPFEKARVFHRAPLLWHRAQACGMATAFFTVQAMDYHGFKDFFLSDGLDAWDTAKDAGLPAVNSKGGDDGWLVGRFDRWLDAELRIGRTTLTVIQFNGTHRPFLQKTGCTRWTPEDVARRRPDVSPGMRSELARYWNAIAYMDHVQEQLLDVLARRGILDHTLIVGTSDHGECFADGGLGRSRMDNLRPETMHVPLWVRTPEGFPVPWRQAMLENRLRLVGNVDLVPTLAEALGCPVPELPFRGRSLLRSFPDDGRLLASANSGEVRQRRPEVASLLWEQNGGLRQWRWHGQEGTACFDVTGDRACPVQADPERRQILAQTLGEIPCWSRCFQAPEEGGSRLRSLLARLLRPGAHTAGATRVTHRQQTEPLRVRH